MTTPTHTDPLDDIADSLREIAVLLRVQNVLSAHAIMTTPQMLAHGDRVPGALLSRPASEFTLEAASEEAFGVVEESGSLSCEDGAWPEQRPDRAQACPATTTEETS